MDGVGKQDYLDQSVGDIGIQRAHTFDSMCLKDEFDKISRLYLENEANEQPLDMEVIPENLSDEYSSINDQDSDSEDLKDQEKNYILDYIRANQIRHDERMVSSEAEEEAAQNNFEAKINNFREIRFKSVEQDVEKEVFKNHLKRMKVSPHKFPDGPVRHLKTKESEFMLQTDGHDPTMVTITQKKKLNERNTHYRKTPKESFMLKDRPK